MRTIRAIQEELEQVKFKLQQTTETTQELEKKERALLETQSKETMATEMDEKLERVQQITNVRKELQRLQGNITEVVQSKNQLEDEFVGMVLELINERDKVESEFIKGIEKAEKLQAAYQVELNSLATKQMEIRTITNRVSILISSTLGPQKKKDVQATIRDVNAGSLANKVRNLFVKEAIPKNSTDRMIDIIR